MKRLLFLCLWLCTAAVHAAVPTFQSFEPTQFLTNNNRIAYIATHTNDAGVIYPALANDLTLVTNLNSYGTFSLPAKVTLLTTGTNYLDVSTNSTWLLNSPTNDATQVILSLSAGAYQGQLTFITSQNGGNSFKLPDLSEQWDVPGAYVDIQGDWVGTTNRGIILQYTAPDWIEMARFDPSTTGGGSVFGSGTSPFLAYWLNATTLTNSPLQRTSSSTVSLLGSGQAVTLGNALVLAQKDNLGIANPTASTGFLANNTFLANSGVQQNSPAVSWSGQGWGTNTATSQSVTFGSFIIPHAGADKPTGQLSFYSAISNTALNTLVFTIDSASGYTGAGTLFLSDDGTYKAAGGGGTTINPTDGFIPYRVNATTFGNSPFNVISTNQVGFSDTNIFFGIYGGGASLGIGSGAAGAVGNNTGFVAVGPHALGSATGGQNSIAIGQNALFNSPASLQDVAVGVNALEADLSGNNNVAVGYNAGDSVNGGIGVVIVGFDADTLSPGDTNSIVIGANAVGHGPATATIGDSTVTALYLGNNLVYPGGGSALWSSAGGVLSPSPAVDVVNITSALADNATNVALVVNTTLPWVTNVLASSHPWLAAFQSAGTNKVTIRAWDGLITVGAAEFDYNTIEAKPGASFLSERHTALGEPAFNQIWVDVFDDAADGSSGNFSAAIMPDLSFLTMESINNTSGIGVDLFIQVNSTDRYIQFLSPEIEMSLNPTASDGTAPYIFGSTTTHTTGPLLTLNNNTTNVVTADYLGRLSIQGQTNLIGDSGSALTYNGVAIGGGAPVGTMVASGISTQYRVPRASDTTGTNYGPSGLVGDGTSTNMMVLGKLSTDSVSPTNGVQFPTSSIIPGTAGVLDQRGGTTSQAYRIYNTYTDASNNEYAQFGFAGSARALVAVVKTGSGTYRDLAFNLNGSDQWAIQASTGLFYPLADNLRDLGWSGGRIKNGYFGTSVIIGASTSLTEDVPGRIQIGIDAASPVSPQILGVADGVGTDKNGSDFQLSGGRGTGTGRGGALIGKTSLTTTTGSSAQTESTRYYHSAKFVDLTESTATLFCNIALASSKYVGVRLNCTVSAADATDFQAVNSNVSFAAVNKAGTVTVGAVTQNDDATAASTGTLTVTFTAVANGAGIDIKANAVSSLTQTSLRCKWMITSLNSDDTAVVTPQ